MTVGDAKLNNMPISTYVALSKSIITMFMVTLIHADSRWFTLIYVFVYTLEASAYVKLFNNQLKVICMFKKCRPDNWDRDAI